MKNVFISYNTADREWAEWIAWHLKEAGHPVEIMAWDFRDGPPVVEQIDAAIANAHTTLAVLSPEYLGSKWCKLEWQAALSLEVEGNGHRLLPVQIKTGELPPLIGSKARVTLLNLVEADARERLLQAIDGAKGPPATAPRYPVTSQKSAEPPPAFPGVRHKVWNIPHERNRNFTGRDELLTRLREALTSGQPAALVQALHGLGGIGKTQLAVEYAYRHVSDYDAVWWVRAEEPVTRSGDLAGLAKALGLPEADAQDQRIVIEAVRTWLSEHPRWLLVLDNVPHPKDLDGLLPQLPRGHILITSRDPSWHERATPLKVDVFERPVSIEFLLKRASIQSADTNPKRERGHGAADAAPSLTLRVGVPEDDAADQLAEELGDLPLALAQAVAYMDETQLSIGKYLELFRQRRTDLWGEEHAPLGRQETVALTFGLNVERLPDPAAVDLLNVCAFLAPDDIPRSLLAQGGEHLPARLAAVVTDDLALNRIMKTLRSFSLVELTDESLSVHRLVQAVCRDRLNVRSSDTGEGEAPAEPCLSDPSGSAGASPSHVSAAKPFAAAAVKLVYDAFPYDADNDPAAWPVCQRLLQHAHAAAKQAEQFGIEPDATGRLLNQVGLFLLSRAEFVEARNALERAVHVAETALGPKHPDVATSVNNLGVVLKALGDLPGAKQAYERAMKIDEKAFGREHPKLARDVNNLGTVLSALGDLLGAKQAFERALKIDEKAFGPDHPEVATDVSNIGCVLKDLGDLSGARQAHERALNIDEKAFGPEHPSVATDVSNLGSVLMALGDLPGAKQAFERALKIDEQAFGPEHPQVAIRCWWIGGLLTDTGDLTGAKQEFERAVGIFRKFLGDEHPNTRRVQQNLEAVNKLLEGQTQSPE